MATQNWAWRRIDDKKMKLEDLILLLNSRFTKLVQVLNYLFGAVQTVSTFANGDTTPSVLGASLFLASNTGATNLTTLDDGTPGQRVTLWATTANTTLVHSAGFFLKGGASVTMTANETREFATADGVNWREV